MGFHNAGVLHPSGFPGKGGHQQLAGANSFPPNPSNQQQTPNVAVLYPTPRIWPPMVSWTPLLCPPSRPLKKLACTNIVKCKERRGVCPAPGNYQRGTYFFLTDGVSLWSLSWLCAASADPPFVYLPGPRPPDSANVQVLEHQKRGAIFPVAISSHPAFLSPQSSENPNRATAPQPPSSECFRTVVKSACSDGRGVSNLIRRTSTVTTSKTSLHFFAIILIPLFFHGWLKPIGIQPKHQWSDQISPRRSGVRGLRSSHPTAPPPPTVPYCRLVGLPPIGLGRGLGSGQTV